MLRLIAVLLVLCFALEPGRRGWAQSVSGNVEDRRNELASKGYKCGEKQLCRDMATCEEAVFHLQFCGLKSLARGADGVPCVSSVCRQGHPGWEARLNLSEQKRDGAWLDQGLVQELPKASTFIQSRATAEPGRFDCGVKKYCKQMASCEEARYRLVVCGDLSLDRDRDGVPCENICR